MSVKQIQSRQFSACRDFLYALKPCEVIKELDKLGLGEPFQEVHRSGELCSPAEIQRLTYIEPCRGGYYPPAGFAGFCGDSFCRVRRLDDPLTCPLCRLRRQRCVESPHPTRTLGNKTVYAKGRIRAITPQSRLCRADSPTGEL